MLTTAVMEARNRTGASTHTTIGIQSMHPPVGNVTAATVPAPMRSVFALPHFGQGIHFVESC